MPTIEDLTSSLGDVFQDLENCPDLSPGPRVNELFGRLVELVLTTPAHHVRDVLADPEIRALRPRLRELCSRGEYELELAWARRVARSPDPVAELALFPYMDNYRQLTRMELTALRGVASKPIRSVAFAGSGPLPLSSLLLAGELGVPVDNHDRDALAITSSRRLVEVLGPPGLRFHQMDVCDADLSGYDVVVLAALVGDTSAEKASMLQRLATTMAPGALLLLRSAHGMRTLLYPEVDLGLLDGFELLSVVHPEDEVINSVVVVRAHGGNALIPGPRTGTER
jgi:hypothetical protein